MQPGGENSLVLAAGSGPTRLDATPRTFERCFDLALTIILMPAFLVAGALIAIAIYIDSPGPVTYRSRRVGRDGQPFDMLKFRKMRREAPSHPVTLDNDARFTPIGRFLAATRLDELPQVWNVLRGEMRLVGPRPELACFVAQFPEEYHEILKVAPGITGNAQLRFLSERHLLSGPDPAAIYSTHVLPAKIKIDLDYSAAHSLLVDLGILVRTALVPVAYLLDHARTPGTAVRRWITPTLASAAGGLLFILASGHLP